MPELTEPDVINASALLTEIPVPSAAYSPSRAPQAETLSPVKRVYLYSPDDWEDFVREWVKALEIDYRQVKRLGGTGDRGIDVAAFHTPHQLEGDWECFQAKHYKDSLTPSDVFPEVLKIFYGVVEGIYTLPVRYAFVSPKGCGNTLNQLLSRPTEFRRRFLEELDKEGSETKKYKPASLRKIRDLATRTDFSRFESYELEDMLEVHSKTRYYAWRFGAALPSRPSSDTAPENLTPAEATYTQKLLEVYQEQDPDKCQDLSAVSKHVKFSIHFQRQREAFYSAESLHRYARDSVPEGTFELLQDDVFEGVIEKADDDFRFGMDRLRAVLDQSVTLNLGAHGLLPVLGSKDRKGICHQLANMDKLTWVDSNE